MPAEGEVLSFLESTEDIKFAGLLPMTASKKQIILNTTKLGRIKVVIIDNYFFYRARLWGRPGDLISLGASIGYLPFGGKVVIEFSDKMNVLVKESDTVQTSRTLIASN